MLQEGERGCGKAAPAGSGPVGAGGTASPVQKARIRTGNARPVQELSTHDVETARHRFTGLGIAEPVVQLCAANDISKQYCNFPIF